MFGFIGVLVILGLMLLLSSIKVRLSVSMAR